MQIPFSKYAGSGNDFILIDNRDQIFSADPQFIKALCDRKRGIGSDGLITFEKGTKALYRMRIFNSDGSEAEMCGNGLRCFKLFLEECGVHQETLEIETHERLLTISKAGLHVKASMGMPTDLKLGIKLEDGFVIDYLNTGVPHAVIFVDDVDAIDVEKVGLKIRKHECFSPKGTNVNFVQIKGSELHVRTYERGVEAETLACGTGMVASACLAALKFGWSSPIQVMPKSLEPLLIDIKLNNKMIAEVSQTGPAQYIFQGSFSYGPQTC